MLTFLSDNVAQAVSSVGLPQGDTSGIIQRAVNFDTSREKEILRITFRNMEETTRDILESFQRRNWLKSSN
jgi:hypothetical protein